MKIVRLPNDIAQLMKPAAIARGIAVSDLAMHIIIAVVDGDLMDAVLDDGVKSVGLAKNDNAPGEVPFG